MGLDAWFFASQEEFKTDSENTGAIVPVDEKAYKDPIEVGYFRKFHPLQDYMEEIYYERGGGNEFNCQKVQLYEQDFKDLLEDTLTGALTTDYMNPDYILYYKTELLIVVHSAIHLLKDGFTVYYDSWW